MESHTIREVLILFALKYKNKPSALGCVRRFIFDRSIIEIEVIGILQIEFEVAGADKVKAAHKFAYAEAQKRGGEDIQSDDFDEG